MMAKTQALNDSHVTAGPRVVTYARNQAPAYRTTGNGRYFAIFEYIHDFSRCASFAHSGKIAASAQHLCNQAPFLVGYA
jgi:hypothetical protein